MNKIWLRAAGIRALKTMAQTIISTVGPATIGFLDIDWKTCVSICITSGILSLAFSIKGLPEVEMEAELNKKEEQNNE